MALCKYLILSGLAVLAPIHAVMITVGIIIIADLVTGLVAAKKRGEKITSAVMRRTITKVLVYQVAVISAFLIEIYLLGGIISASKIVAGVIGVVELTSILENCNSILGTNVFAAIIKKLGSVNDNLTK